MRYFTLAVKWKGHTKFSPEFGAVDAIDVLDEIDDEYRHNDDVEDYVIVITWDSEQDVIERAFKSLNESGCKDYRKNRVKWFRA